MLTIAKYDDFRIYRHHDKLFVIADFNPPKEIKEVFRVKFPESEQYSDTEILELCPEEYDYSGEPINESDYVFWKCVEDAEGLKVSPELEKRYSQACRICLERHEAIYGGKPHNCAFKQFDNEYCPDIVNAERQRENKDRMCAPSSHLEQYLKFLECNDGHSYNYIVDNASKFSKVELIAIIRAFDYAIAPYINYNPDETYQAVAGFVRNELRHGHATERSKHNKSLAELIKNGNETYLTDITGTLGEWFDTDFIGVPDAVISLLQDAYALAVQELSK